MGSLKQKLGGGDPSDYALLKQNAANAMALLQHADNGLPKVLGNQGVMLNLLQLLTADSDTIEAAQTGMTTLLEQIKSYSDTEIAELLTLLQQVAGYTDSVEGELAAIRSKTDLLEAIQTKLDELGQGGSVTFNFNGRDVSTDRGSPGIVSNGLKEPALRGLANAIQIHTGLAVPLSNGNYMELNGDKPHNLAEKNPTGVLVTSPLVGADFPAGLISSNAQYQDYRFSKAHQAPNGDLCLLFYNYYGNDAAYPQFLFLIIDVAGNIYEQLWVADNSIIPYSTNHRAAPAYWELTFDTNISQFILTLIVSDAMQNWNADPAAAKALGIDRDGVTVLDYHSYSNRMHHNSPFVSLGGNLMCSKYTDNVFTPYTYTSKLRNFISNIYLGAAATSANTLTYSHITFLNDRMIVAGNPNVDSNSFTTGAGTTVYRQSYARPEADAWIIEIMQSLGCAINTGE